MSTTDTELNLSHLSNVLINKRDLNNFQYALEILWSAAGIYYVKKAKGEDFLEEDKKIINENYQYLKAIIEPII
jgi:hypothetical protein